MTFEQFEKMAKAVENGVYAAMKRIEAEQMAKFDEVIKELEAENKAKEPSGLAVGLTQSLGMKVKGN